MRKRYIVIPRHFDEIFLKNNFTNPITKNEIINICKDLADWNSRNINNNNSLKEVSDSYEVDFVKVDECSHCDRLAISDKDYKEYKEIFTDDDNIEYFTTKLNNMKLCEACWYCIDFDFKYGKHEDN